MAERTKIEWCDATFNPWLGCTKVSAACDHCYAEGWAKRTGQAALWQGDRRRTIAANWREPLKWNLLASIERRRRRVFCASLADVFDNQVPSDWRADLFALISETPDLDWLLLTKRPQNAADMIGEAVARCQGKLAYWPWPNVWLGTTAENQEEYDRRQRHLAAVDARIHFISYEPALGPLSIAGDLPIPDWVIVGAESGPGARSMDLNWVRDIRDECAAAGVPLFFKQKVEGGRKISLPELDGCRHAEFPA